MTEIMTFVHTNYATAYNDKGITESIMIVFFCSRNPPPSADVSLIEIHIDVTSYFYAINTQRRDSYLYSKIFQNISILRLFVACIGLKPHYSNFK